MDAKEFFQTIVKPNYQESDRNPDDLRLLWNAVVSMNTVAEYVALDRLGYSSSLIRSKITSEADKIRKQFVELDKLNECAVTFKHVRRHKGQVRVATATGVSPDRPSTYRIDGDDLRLVLNQAYVAISQFQELN